MVSMAADQRRKHLNGASIAGCNSRDQYRTKKKNLESLQNDLNTKSCISLAWDGNQKKVLADVLTLPHENFALENLTEAFSYEVWQTHLSENERNLLMQFLPTETDKEQVLQALLAGVNFHFGNPFFKWRVYIYIYTFDTFPPCGFEDSNVEFESARFEWNLCLQGIIEFLQKLKENWESCKDPEQEIVQKLWRFVFATCFTLCLVEVHKSESLNIAFVKYALPEFSASFSVVPSQRVLQNVSGKIHTEQRMYKKGFIKDKGRMQLTAPDYALTVEARPKKGDNIRKRNIQQCDGAKYMSYFKVEIGKGRSACIICKLERNTVTEIRNNQIVEARYERKTKSTIGEEDEDTGKLQDQEDNVGTNLAVLDALPQNQSSQQISSIDSGHMCNRVDMEFENNVNLSKSDLASSDVSEHSENLNTADATVSQEVPVSSAENVWPADSMPHSYHDSTAGHEYTSTSGLPLTHQANEDQQNQIDLESDLHEESTGKVLLHGHSENGSFSSYINQDRNELLQSFFKDQGMLSYHCEQKQTGLGFQPPKNLLIEDGHFNGFQPRCAYDKQLDSGKGTLLHLYDEDGIGTYTCVNLRRAKEIIGTTKEEVVLKAKGGGDPHTDMGRQTNV
ncbi:hypothetical protein CRYUN_Cryun17cG0000800 [Craigia yunnanensis]